MTGLMGVLLVGAVASADAAGATRRVYAGVYLRDVTALDLKAGVFDADVELWAKWLGEFDPDLISVANAGQIERTFLGSEADGEWRSARWRLRGQLRGRFPVEQFPFDEQTLAVVLELRAVHGELVPDLAGSSMAESFSLSDWKYDPEFSPATSQATFTSDLGRIEGEGEPTSVRRVAFQVVMRRPIVTAALKLFLPLAIIILVALIALFLLPHDIEARSGMGVTALLSCFAFQFTVGDSLPAVAYLTTADILFLIAYILSTLSIVSTIVGYSLEKSGKLPLALRVDRVVRWTLPVGAAVVIAILVPRPPAPQPEPPDALPAVERPDSARDVLRIGTTMLPSATGASVAAPSFWPLLYESPEGETQSWLVERAPDVTNTAMRFLASGELEVRWRLREGASWSDGTPITVKDFAFAHEASPNAKVVEARAGRPREWIVRWEERLARALDSPWVLPEHRLRKIFDDGAYKAVRDLRRAEATPSIGPYRYVSFEKKKRAVIEANPHFIGPPPAIARVELTHFGDRQALIDALRAGDIDMTELNSLTLEQARAFAHDKPDWVHINPSGIAVVLVPDLEHPVLGRLEVRRALLAAVDRARIARAVYGDAGRVADIPVPGPAPAAVTPNVHDPARARAVLSRLPRAPIPLFHSKSPVDTMIVAELMRDWRAAGAPVVPTQVESTFKKYRERDHGGLVLHALRGARDSSPRRYWNLPLVDGRYPPDARNDAYTDVVHDLVGREARALYDERREQLRDLLFAAYAERLPHLPLVFAAGRVIVDPQLRGWQTDPQVRFGKGMETWHFAVPPAPAIDTPTDPG